MEIVDKQTRINEAEKFFNLIFGNVTERKFGYLWTKQDKATYPFTVSNSDERKAMAKQAIELADKGFDVYFGVNLMDDPAAKNRRVKAEQVTLQTATITDIDVEGGAHKSTADKIYPPNFDVAKSFLPCPVSILVDSGFGGVHGYCLYSKPITVTAENRDACTMRNKKFIDATRRRAGVFSGAVDGVGDLPRVLRVPGTFNYKCGKENAPLVKLVEVTDIRFTPADMDERLNALTPKQETKQVRKQEKDSTLVYQSPPDSAGYDLWRATKMLDYINPEQLDYDNWFAVVTACKTVGLSYAVVDAWSRRDTTVAPNGKPRYNETENLAKWNEPINPAYNIETLAGKARDCGYNEKDSWREWCELHPEFKGKVTRRPAPMSDDDSDEREDFIWTQDIIKSCPVNLRLPDNYKFNKSGIYLVVETKKETKYICAARTPILPTEKFREPIKGTIEYKFTILDSGKWRNVEIDGGALADTRELSKTLSRHGAQIKKSEPLREFLVDILSLNPDLKEIKTYSRTGWHDGKFIYPTGGTDYIVRRPNFNFEEICKPKGNAELWKQKFKEVMEQGGATAQVFFGVALSAPLAEPIIGANPSAQLFGKSGGGKTGLQKFVSSFYGNPRELVRTFAATNKNRLLVADAFNGLPTFLDELETVQGKAAEEALSTDVYNFYDGTGNQANKRDGNAREMFKFRASRLATGERQILKQHDLRGAYKRLLPLKAKANFLPDELATDLHFFSESNYGHFGKVWIDFVAEHLEEIKKQYEFCAKFYTPLKRYEPTHLKMLAAAVVSVEFFSVAIGVKNEFDKAACVRNMRDIVDTLPTTDELDDTTRAVESLSSYVASHTKSFNRPVKDPDTGKINEVVAWGIVCNGRIFENGEVAFLPTELRRILEDELKFPSANKLINEWKEQGNVLITDKDRLTHKAPIGDDRPRTIHFKARILVTCPDDEELLYYEEKGVV